MDGLDFSPNDQLVAFPRAIHEEWKRITIEPIRRQAGQYHNCPYYVMPMKDKI
jgi:hypothetical protein